MLQAATIELAVADEDAVRTKQRYEVAFAKAFLSSEGSAEARKQSAVLAVENPRLDMEIAAAKLRAVRARIDTLKVQIDVGRSFGAALRAEIALTQAGAA
jgi:hypothetical protein